MKYARLYARQIVALAESGFHFIGVIVDPRPSNGDQEKNNDDERPGKCKQLLHQIKEVFTAHLPNHHLAVHVHAVDRRHNAYVQTERNDGWELANEVKGHDVAHFDGVHLPDGGLSQGTNQNGGQHDGAQHQQGRTEASRQFRSGRGLVQLHMGLSLWLQPPQLKHQSICRHLV